MKNWCVTFRDGTTVHLCSRGNVLQVCLDAVRDAQANGNGTWDIIRVTIE